MGESSSNFEFLENLTKNFKFYSNLTKIAGTLQGGLVYIYDISLNFS